LEILYFLKKSDYMRMTRMKGSAGVYIPEFRAGFFFKDGGINFPTMIHEMTHQYNHKLLQCVSHGWFEEGSAEYFGAGYLSKGGKQMKLGLPDVNRMTKFGNMAKGAAGEPEPEPLRTFHVREAELTGEFYAQSWALVHFLMEVHPRGRWVLFDYVAHLTGLAKQLEMDNADGVCTLEHALRLNGLTLSEFEKDFLAHYSGKKK
ncbi:MAG: DUF1570 domain-containing protein, partial [Cyanothece sp. SIO1E1]|nr:DUF1570 domain-containing protein [Cyanothece sp. SIO1E1]